MIENAYAKINLSLDVVRKREDGYHDVNMIMQSLELHDSVSIELLDSGIEVSCDGAGVPSGEDNIAYRAAKLMLDETKSDCGIRIHIKKNIPVCAGLAGGSTDGAAVIRALNVLLNANFGAKKLQLISASVGSDVPFCINGGTAQAYGTGTEIKQLPCFGKKIILLVKPPINVSTPWVYKNLNLCDCVHPDIDAFINSLSSNDYVKALSFSGNALESVTVKKYPVINNIKTDMIAYGARFSMMSGSGPTVFGIFDKLADAENAEKCFKKSFDEVIVTQTV